MVTALVLSGGGSLGAVQVGMLLALADRGVEADLLVGSSVGALNAAFLAGPPGAAGVRELARIWVKLRRTDIFPTDAPRLLRAVAGRVSGLADPGPLRALMHKNLTYRRLEDAPRRVAVVATDVLAGEEVVYGEGPAVEAVMASAALPAAFPPVRIGHRLLMDGGVVNNTPISVARRLGADTIYVLPTGYACALSEAPRSPVGMALHAVTLAIQQRLVADVRALQDRIDLHVAPPLCPLTISPIDFRHTASLIDRARSATGSWLDRPVPSDQARNLAMHSHAILDTAAASTGPT